ncbi:MAG: alpha/beta hydrolase fold domain-containing protein [Reyranellaceae bacterium]
MASAQPPRVLRDVAYGEARVGYAGTPRAVTLAFDAYLPPAGTAGPTAALMLAFGGAFHRGSKEDDCFPAAGAYGPNTAVAEYCRRFAAEGIACFSVAYRLAPDDPDPGTTPVLTRPDSLPMGRIEVVRELMGLPPATPHAMAGVVEAAIDDVTAAARALRARADEFGIDPDRLVLGGWSAGARCALYAAYAERVPCAGVLALSGTMMPEDIEAHVRSGDKLPPLLVVAAEEDVPYIRDGAAPMVQALRERGCDARRVRVPRRDHWYAAEAVTDTGQTVQAVLRDAVRAWTGV